MVDIQLPHHLKERCLFHTGPEADNPSFVQSLEKLILFRGKNKTPLEWDGDFKLDNSKPDGVLEKKVNPKLGEKILNWSPKTTIDEGIKLTVGWFIENEKNITQ